MRSFRKGAAGAVLGANGRLARNGSRSGRWSFT